MSSVTSERADKATELIQSAPERHLRAALFALCNDNRTRDKVIKHIEALTQDDGVRAVERERTGAHQWICVQCETLFNQEENGPDHCQYHPGSVFLDESSEVWCDTDDFMMEGLKEDEAMMEEFPDGYQWSCCEQQYDAAPCRTAAHTQYPGKKNNDKTISQQKRARDEEENEARKERKI